MGRSVNNWGKKSTMMIICYQNYLKIQRLRKTSGKINETLWWFLHVKVKGIMCVLNFLWKTFVYFWERERERERAYAFAQVGEGQQERRTKDLKLCWQQPAQCGAWTHKPQNHDLSQSRMLNRLSYLGSPVYY